MKKLLMTAAAATALFSFTPTFSSAQGVAIDTPVGGVRVGAPATITITAAIIAVPTWNGGCTASGTSASAAVP